MEAPAADIDGGNRYNINGVCAWLHWTNGDSNRDKGETGVLGMFRWREDAVMVMLLPLKQDKEEEETKVEQQQ